MFTQTFGLMKAGLIITFLVVGGVAYLAFRFATFFVPIAGFVLTAALFVTGIASLAMFIPAMFVAMPYSLVWWQLIIISLVATLLVRPTLAVSSRLYDYNERLDMEDMMIHRC